ncbi:uncharacterized protein LOC130912319 isoform X2 [Corythoichthys intestinalis]|uniref:uncharacterized protein LOC130912319 isoform X2 n=1 Tax=Corythoichthys intestinalis TaxID=161448 RepID=UPI0025A5955D|nr:uncharacterized protein LOC130912319 isoform X2 [Corythoichthys intestinalis]
MIFFTIGTIYNIMMFLLVTPPLKAPNEGARKNVLHDDYVEVPTDDDSPKHPVRESPAETAVSQETLPQILDTSGCRLVSDRVICSCISRANPAPSLQWVMMQAVHSGQKGSTEMLDKHTVKLDLILKNPKDRVEMFCVSSNKLGRKYRFFRPPESVSEDHVGQCRFTADFVEEILCSCPGFLIQMVLWILLLIMDGIKALVKKMWRDFSTGLRQALLEAEAEIAAEERKDRTVVRASANNGTAAGQDIVRYGHRFGGSPVVGLRAGGNADIRAGLRAALLEAEDEIAAEKIKDPIVARVLVHLAANYGMAADQFIGHYVHRFGGSPVVGLRAGGNADIRAGLRATHLDKGGTWGRDADIDSGPSSRPPLPRAPTRLRQYPPRMARNYISY